MSWLMADHVAPRLQGDIKLDGATQLTNILAPLGVFLFLLFQTSNFLALFTRMSAVCYWTTVQINVSVC